MGPRALGGGGRRWCRDDPHVSTGGSEQQQQVVLGSDLADVRVSRGGATDKGRSQSPSVRLGVLAQGGGRLLPQRQLTFCLSVCQHPACVISGGTHSHPVTSAVPPPPFTVKETEVECSGLACRAVTDEWPSWG